MMTNQLLKRLFSVQEYQQMIELGIFAEKDRLELIKGEIIEMSPVGIKHAACVKRLNEMFGEKLRKRALIGVQDPVKLNDYSQPQPDICLLRVCEDFYESAHPTVADIFLLIELADTSINFDRNIKINLYAEAGVVEVWLVDINQEVIEVYRHPKQGKYEQFLQCYRGDKLVITAFDEIVFEVNQVLG